MSALTKRLTRALEYAIGFTEQRQRVEYQREFADLGVARFNLGIHGFGGGAWAETVLVDIADAPSSPTRLEQLMSAVNRSGIPNAVIISDSLNGLTRSARVIGAKEFLGLNLPWAAVSTMPQDSAVPSEVDPDRFESDYVRRSGRLCDSQGKVTVGDADAQMRSWLSNPRSKPLVLTGMRGVGKTWQLIHFCRTSWQRFEQSNGEHVPVVYVNLGNARVARVVLNGHPSGHAALQMILAHYGTSDLPWRGAMLAAFIDTGLVAMALDGFDEVYKQPTDAEVFNLGVSLRAQFAPGARFLVAGRSVFVRFLDDHSQLPLAGECGGAPRGWLSLELQPVEWSSGLSERQQASPALSSLNMVLRTANGHPALHAEIVRLSPDGVADAEVVRAAVVNVFIDFNLRYDRTHENYVREVDGEVVRRSFSATDRLAFLAELAWHMAERGLATIPVDRLPRRIARQFGLDNEAMRLDVRSQLVLEENGKVDGPAHQTSMDGHGLSFAISMAGDSMRPAVGHTLTGAMFLAEFLFDRLSEVFDSPSLGLPHFMRFLGRVRLSEGSALFLNGRIAELSSRTGRQVGREVKQGAIDLLQSLAKAGGGEVFIACLRHLAQNLRQLGLFSDLELARWDPWHDFVLSESDHVVLVPAASSERLEGLMANRANRLSRSCRRCTSELVPRQPFLLGIHEVTNSDYADFVASDSGREWQVRRIIRAASAEGVPPSPFSRYTNEYHLYFWQEDRAREGYHPLPGSFDLPVSYVSWYAAAAYCDWMSAKAGRVGEYGFTQHRREKVLRDSPGRSGFRLPSLGEWLWAAYGATVAGPRSDFDYPWDWLACGVQASHVPAAVRRRVESMRDTQLESGKQVGPVLEDELLDSGVSGLVGNVKEWVDDAEADPAEAELPADRHVIAGATAYLGIESFVFGYYVSLFSQNTNPDVGFRVARSLDADELAAVEARERQLAAGGPVQ